MYYLKNTTEADLTVVYGGTPYLFPKGEVVAIDVHDVAKWFIHKCAVPPDMKAKPPRVREVFPLVMVQELGAKEKPGKEYRFKPVPPPEPEALLKARAEYRLQGPPRPADQPVEPPPAVQEEMAKKAIAKMDADQIRKAAQKLKLFKPGMEKAELVDELHKAGFKPPQ